MVLKNRKLLNQNNSNSNNTASGSGEKYELSSRTYGQLVDDDDSPAVPWPWTSVSTMAENFERKGGANVAENRERKGGFRTKYIPSPPTSRRNVIIVHKK